MIYSYHNKSLSIYEEKLNYIGVILIIIILFYNFQLDNIFLKFIVGLKDFFYIYYICKILY